MDTTGLFLISWHFTQNRYTWMKEEDLRHCDEHAGSSRFICTNRAHLVSSVVTRGAGWVKMAATGIDEVVSCLSTNEHSGLWLCCKDFGPSSEMTLRRGRASSCGMKISSVTCACTSQHIHDDQALRRRQWTVWGRIFNAAFVRSLTEQVESWISHNELCGKFFASVSAEAIQSYFQPYKCTVVVCFLLGNCPASEFYMPTFRNALSVPSS